MPLFKRLLLNAVSLNSAKLIEGLIELAIVAFVLSAIGRESYGAALLIISIQKIVALTRGGMGKATFKYIAEYNAKADFVSSQRVLSTSFVIQGGLGLLGLLVCLLISPFISTIFFLPDHLHTDARIGTLLVGVGVLVTFSLFPCRSIVVAHERYDLVSLTRIINKVVRAVLIVLLFVFFVPNLVNLVFATVLGNITQLVMCLLISRRIETRLKLTINKFSMNTAKRIFRFSFFDMLHVLSSLMHKQGALYIANRMISLDAVAGLGVVRNITNLLGMLIGQVATILVPVSSRLEVEGENQKLLQLVIHGTTLTVFVGGALVTGIIPWIDSLLRVWLGLSFTYLSGICTLLLCGQLLINSVSCIHATLAGTGRVVVDGTSNLCCTILGLTIGLVLLLFSELGLMGLATGLFCVMLFRFVFITGYGTLTLGIPLGSFIWIGYLRTYLLSGIVVVVTMIIQPSADSWPMLLIGIASTATVFVIPGILFIVDREDLLRFKDTVVYFLRYVCRRKTWRGFR